MDQLKKQFKEVKALFGDNKHISIDPSDSIRLQDIFSLMIERKYVTKRCYDNKIHYQLNVPLVDFENWFKAEEKKEKKLSRREWKIAITSAVIGAIIGLIPTFISLFCK